MMKNFTTKGLLFLAFLLMMTSINLSAQQNSDSSSDGVTIIQKITTQDGSTVVKKKRLQKGEDVDAYLKALELENVNDENVTIDINSEGEHHTMIINGNESKDENTIFFLRRSKAECGTSDDGPDNVHIIMNGEKEEFDHESYQWDEEEFKKNFKYEWKEGTDWSKFNWKDEKDWDQNYEWHGGNSWNNEDYVEVKKPLLGVYLEDEEQAPGILLSGVTSSGGAKAAGLQKGDVILTVNGTAVDNVYDLRKVLDKNKPGDAVQIMYQRNGANYTTSSILGEKTSYERQRDPCRPFIGVVIGDYSHNEKGVRIQRIVPNTSAEEANLQAGDYILAIDDVATHTHSAVVKERDKHQAGDYYVVTINRNGQVMDVDAQFGPCENEQPAVTETPQEEVLPLAPQTEQTPTFSIDNTLEVQDFSTYPNPTYGAINVKFKAEMVPTTVQVSDLTGKVIYQEVLNNFNGFYEKQLNVGNAVPGAMNLTIRQGDKIYTKQFVLVARA